MEKDGIIRKRKINSWRKTIKRKRRCNKKKRRINIFEFIKNVNKKRKNELRYWLTNRNFQEGSQREATSCNPRWKI